jgi:hypothetical protein
MSSGICQRIAVEFSAGKSSFETKNAENPKKLSRSIVPNKTRLTRISHQISTAAADPGMPTALRSVGLLDILLSMPAGPCFALAGLRQMRLVSMPVCAASLRNLGRNAR